MIEKIEELAVKFKDRTAYSVGENKVSFGGLFERAQKIAKELGGKDKFPVAVVGGRSADTMAAILGCIIAGRAYVPIDISTPKERKNRIIKASNASIVLYCTDTGITFGKTENGVFSKSENETAYIIFTSGSTGEPKGVPISYENLDNFIRWITALEPMDGFEHEAVLNQAAFSFDLSTAAIFYSLFKGHNLVQIEDKNDFCGIFKTIKKNKTGVFVITPTFMRLCLLEKSFCEKEYPFLKCVYFCGEALQKSLVKAVFERFPNVRIINAYGPTEATSAVCAVEITKETIEHEDILPVGKIDSSATEIFIDDGEIVLKGKSVFSGYVGKKDERYFEKGYRTGDIGYIRNGFLYCIGRNDSQIKFKGYRIELMEIEKTVLDIPGVEDCAVVAKKNPQGEVRMIKAFVSGKIGEEEIRKNLSEKLPEYMIPKITVLEKLPVNENGKTDRKELMSL